MISVHKLLRVTIILTIFPVLLLTSYPTPAESEAPEAAPSPAAASTEPDAAPAKPVHPAMIEIRGLIEVQEARLSELKAELATVADHQEVLRLHREIQDTKVQTELEILRCQIRHARAEGRVEIADKLERAVTEIDARLKRDDERPQQVTTSER